MSWRDIKDLFAVVAVAVAGVIAAITFTALSILLAAAPFVLVILALAYVVRAIF